MVKFQTKRTKKMQNNVTLLHSSLFFHLKYGKPIAINNECDSINQLVPACFCVCNVEKK